MAESALKKHAVWTALILVLATAMVFAPLSQSYGSIVVQRRSQVRVRDARTGALIAQAPVFLSDSYVGSTDSSGSLILGQPIISQQLAVTVDGYNPYLATATFDNFTVYLTQNLVLSVAADGSGAYRTIQGAINGLPLQGGEIQIKDGTYHEVISIQKSNVALRALGTNVIIKIDMPNATAISIGSYRGGQTGVLIEGLHIVGEGTSTWDGGRGVWVYNSAHTTITKVTIENMGSSGIELRDASMNTIEDSDISNCRKHGIALQGSSDNMITRTVSHDNGLANFILVPSALNASERNKFTYCTSQNPYDNGFYIDGGSNSNEISNSYSKDAVNSWGANQGGSGIMVKGNANMVADNIVTNCRIGIQLAYGASSNHVLGNLVTQSVAGISGSGTGILINDNGASCTNNEISNNRCLDNQRDGMEIGTNASHNSVSGCTLSNSGRYDLDVSGTYNTATQNSYETFHVSGSNNQVDLPI